MKQAMVFFLSALLLLLCAAGCGETKCKSNGDNPDAKKTCGEMPQYFWEVWDTGGNGQDDFWEHGAQVYDDLRQHSFSDMGADFGVDISRDGKWMAFASTNNSERPDIYMKPVDGRSLTRITTSDYDDIQPAISPDGKMIAFASNREGYWGIWITGTSGRSGFEQVTSREDGNCMSPSWSADGKKLCYCSRMGLEREWVIWIYDRETGRKGSLGPGMYPKWNPGMDGDSPYYDTIVFQRPRQRGEAWFEIWMVNVNGGRPTQVVSSAKWGAIQPSWNKTGDLIVFATVYESQKAKEEGRAGKGDDIFVIDPMGRKKVNVTQSGRSDWGPIWGTDGRIYFSSNRNGFNNIWSLFPWTTGMEPMRVGKGDLEKDGNNESHASAGFGEDGPDGWLREEPTRPDNRRKLPNPFED